MAVWGGHLSRGSPDRAGVRSAAIYDRALLPGHEGRVFPGPLWAADGFGGASVSRVVPPSLPPGPLGEALSGGRGAFLVGGLAEGGGLLGVDDGHREAGLQEELQEGEVIGAGGFQDHQVGSVMAESLQEGLAAFGGVGEAKGTLEGGGEEGEHVGYGRLGPGCFAGEAGIRWPPNTVTGVQARQDLRRVPSPSPDWRYMQVLR